MIVPLLSIIVPVYKTEDYLPACIESVLNQAVSDYELILVDDGSPDGSGKICDSYAEKYSNIRVIHKENEGQTATRKAGLRIATGTYFAFLDSDDWVDPHMYSVPLQQAEDHGADLVAVGFVRDFDDHSESFCNGYPSGVYRGEGLKQLQQDAVFYGPQMKEGVIPSLCTKIFRRETMADVLLERCDTIRFGEDSLCTHSMIAKANCVVLDNDHRGYHYRIWGGSITQAYYKDYFHDLFVLQDELALIYPHAHRALAIHYANLYVGGLLQELYSGRTCAEKRMSLCALAADRHLDKYWQDMDLHRFPRRLRHYIRLMKAGQPELLLAYHSLYASAAKLKRLLVP